MFFFSMYVGWSPTISFKIVTGTYLLGLYYQVQYSKEVRETIKLLEIRSKQL